MSHDVIASDADRVCDRVSLDALSGARVLITGASGLIGTYLLASLAAARERGTEVHIHAQSFSEPPPHLQTLVERSETRLIRADLSNADDYVRLPEADVIVHAAGYAQPLKFMANPAATLQIGSSATVALLQRVRPGGHFLFLSSAQVYTGLNGICQEDAIGVTTPAHPRAPYIEGKRAGETACHAFRRHGVHATAARLGDVYGPGTKPHDQRALNSFIEQAVTRGTIQMLDAGAAVRTLGYVSDIVETLWRVLLQGRDTVYNVGGRTVTTIADIAATIGRVTGTRVISGPPHGGVAGAPDALALDLTRVESEFGRPRAIDLETGLAATIAWQRTLYS